MDWHCRYSEIDAGSEDDIREHPEIWEHHELPDCLEEVARSDYISIYIAPQLNLNAIAIGLGLDTVEYEPDKFPGLIHYHPEIGCPGIISNGGPSLVISISEDAEATREAIVSTIDTVEDLELIHVDDGWEKEIDTRQVGDVLS